VFSRYAADYGIRALRNKVNSGSVFKQWNKGVSEARGELIWIAEADDYADCRFLERAVDIFSGNPNVGLVYCQSWRVDENSKTIGSMTYWTSDLDEHRWQSDFCAPGRKEVATYLIRKNTIPNASAVVFRREIYQSIGGANETLRLCGDWMAWAHMLLKCDLYFTREHLNYYRAHRGTIRATTHARRHLLESYMVTSFILANVQVREDVRELALNSLARQWANQSCLDREFVNLTRWLCSIVVKTDRTCYLRLLLALARNLVHPRSAKR
jgi:hypothetical protein